MESIIGSTIESEALKENMDFIRDSRRNAMKHEWLYQCTNIGALKNILKSREIWLSNLQDVNDKKEADCITVSKFERWYFVACFTYDDMITLEHWEEYGSKTEGVLYGFKPQWVVKEADFMQKRGVKMKDRDYRVCRDYKEASRVMSYESKMSGRVCNPYYFYDFDFYQIVYDDNLKKDMQGFCSWKVDDETELEGRAITPGVPGIIKSTHGLCRRSNEKIYDKDWTTEKEVRLKAGITSYDSSLLKKVKFPYLAVKLSECAFETLKIRFSPFMPRNKQKEYLEELKELVPDACIQVLND